MLEDGVLTAAHSHRADAARLLRLYGGLDDLPDVETDAETEALTAADMAAVAALAASRGGVALAADKLKLLMLRLRGDGADCAEQPDNRLDYALLESALADLLAALN